MATYDENKFTELLLYVARALRDDPKGGTTKINKVMFFADFTFARTHGVPITGADYQKLEHGPAPRRLRPVRQQLIESGHATVIEEGRPPYVQSRVLPLREPDTSVFSDDELATVDQIVGLFRGKTAREISDLSHEHMGWKHVELGDTIPYDSAILRRPVVTDAIRLRALGIAQQAGRA